MPRPKKPTALLKFEGDYYASRHGDRSGEPQFDGKPTPPDNLTGAALEYWHQLAPGLTQSGVATQLDSLALGNLCWWVVESERLKALPLDERPEKWLYLVQVADKAVRDYMARFGLTPSDRAKINVVPQEASDPAAEFIA